MARVDQRTEASKLLIVVLDDTGRNRHIETRSFMCDHESAAQSLHKWLLDNGITSIVVNTDQWKALPDYPFGE